MADSQGEDQGARRERRPHVTAVSEAHCFRTINENAPSCAKPTWQGFTNPSRSALASMRLRRPLESG